MIWSGCGIVTLSAEIPEVEALFSLQPSPAIKTKVAIMKLRPFKSFLFNSNAKGFTNKSKHKKSSFPGALVYCSFL
jgi:hypothetical protein